MLLSIRGDISQVEGLTRHSPISSFKCIRITDTKDFSKLLELPGRFLGFSNHTTWLCNPCPRAHLPLQHPECSGKDHFPQHPADMLQTYSIIRVKG